MDSETNVLLSYIYDSINNLRHEDFPPIVGPTSITPNLTLSVSWNYKTFSMNVGIGRKFISSTFCKITSYNYLFAMGGISIPGNRS